MMSMPDVHPLVCAPLLKPKIWGGRNLERLFGYLLPPGENIGEAWLAADIPEGASQIANPPFTGCLLSEAVQAWGGKLLGSAWPNRTDGNHFPLLVKFLDARLDLSIQVHPDASACRIHFPEHAAKDESWIVLDALPGGFIQHGFHPGVTVEQFDRLLAENRVSECIRRVEARVGAFFRIVPGTIHAIGGGVTLLEIQEPSDSTFRIYDYGRPGSDGNPRPLHLDAARKTLRFDEHPTPFAPDPIATRFPSGRHTLLADTPAYRIEMLVLESAAAWRVDPRSLQMLILITGNMLLEAGSQTFPLKAGDCVILPAALGETRATPETGNAKMVLAGAGGVPMYRPG